MNPGPRENAAAAALLMEAGFDLMRQNLRRRRPQASREEIEMEFRAWLCREGEQIPGDVAGRVRERRA